jgi:hypothetical protein
MLSDWEMQVAIVSPLGESIASWSFFRWTDVHALHLETTGAVR